MAHANHLHLYATQWLETHPRWEANFKANALALGIGALLAAAAVIALKTGVATWPSTGAPARTALVASPPVGASADAEVYLPKGFVTQATNARIEDLPAQF